MMVKVIVWQFNEKLGVKQVMINQSLIPPLNLELIEILTQESKDENICFINDQTTGTLALLGQRQEQWQVCGSPLPTFLRQNKVIGGTESRF